MHNNGETLRQKTFFPLHCIFYKEELFSLILDHIQIEYQKLHLSISKSEGNHV